MPLTPTQRQQLRLYTGYPSTGLQVNRILENAMDAVDANNSAELLTMLGEELAAVVTLDGQITRGAGTYAGGGFKRIEDVEYFGPGANLIPLRQTALMHVTRLCTLLGVPLVQNPFSGPPNGGPMRWG